jgi:addiction module HigA family antidote
LKILLEEFLEPLNLSRNRLANAIDVPPRRINEIVLGKRRITADTALHMSRYFVTSEPFCMNLQSRFDLELERDRISKDLERITPLIAI